ncbi:hypothetical protein BDM02DRAFT_2283682 [Thelephora ganbajun]|uniref:Uncharacterized protein n=1 Tax=Thelephora ganbajun TaxID=370292 RepID=A0ACB6ZG95_THEGA|nr:hypothetical protein BDM02DRAFT_2283682 [Thelephora ganbajun]
MDTSLGFATIQLHPSSASVSLTIFSLILTTCFIQFGNLMTFTKFDFHLIIFWEACLAIYPMPTLPEAGHSAILDPIQVFFFRLPIQSPIACSPCTSSNLPNSGFALPSKSKHSKALSICYQIAGTGRIHGSILTRNTDSEEADTPPFRLARSPFIVVEDCTCMRVGYSGRGLWLDSSNNVYRCSTVSMVTIEGGEYLTLDMGRRSLMPLCTLPVILKDHRGDWALDFDEGMGRIVYCDEEGLVSIVDVV